MKTSRILALTTAMVTLLGSLCFTSCQEAKTSIVNNGFSVSTANETVEQGGARKVRLLVVDDNIIHVSATAEKRFSKKESLIVVPSNRDVHYTMYVEGDTAVLRTNALTAYVRKSTGEVWFTNQEGKLFLKEKQGGGKTFAPYTCEQIHANGTPETYHGWTTRQQWENLFPEEGLFGLGQHQGDEWNWKGKNEELFQYNTKVSIPFIVSSEGYGVLFDTYSLCRWGNPLPYSQLHELFDIADKDGVAGAFTGTYTAEGEETLVRREDSIYFEDIFTGKNLPKFPLGKAFVTYEGTITPKQSGEYRFCHYYSGYQQILIDGKPLSQQIWRTAWNPNARKYSVEMEAGKTYQLRIEWRPDGGEAYCGLRAYAPVPEEEQQMMSLWSEMTQQIDYYVIYGGEGQDRVDKVVGGYRELTGKAPIMPEWVHGYWQSRERYKTQDEILTALDGFRQRHLPIDNIVMDWNYWEDDQWGAFKFDPARFSNPQEMIDSIHRQHAKIMISTWPKYYLATDNYKEMQDKGYIYQQSLKDSIYDWLGYMYAFYDAYQPEARQIFWRQLWENLGVMGIDSWWMDASEPNVRDCTPIEYRKLLCGPTYLGSSDEYFNAYALVNAEAIYNGQRQTQTKEMPGQPLPRVFLLTRNGFAGQQRYSTATWSGDIGTRWEDLKAQITAGLNFSIAGIPYWSQDIGGFSVETRFVEGQQVFNATGKENADLKEWRELNARWHQWGMFTPMYRSHGQYPFREPWELAPEGHPAYESVKACLELRYRLMPYIYSLAGKVHFEDYTMLRPLVMNFPDDHEAVACGYQFMLGDQLMVCPIYEYGVRERDVYFPTLAAGCWYDLQSGKAVSRGGEKKVVSAPYEKTPVYVPSGAIIPMGEEMEYTREKTADVIRLMVYPGADGEFCLYEDEGDNYNYEQGKYATIRFRYDEASKTLSIGEREGEFDGMLQEREFVVVNAAEQALNPDADGIRIRYNGSSVSAKL